MINRGKKYINKFTDEVNTIMEVVDNEIVIMDNGKKVKTSHLNNPSLYMEASSVDTPNIDFSGGGLQNQLFGMLNNIDTNNINDNNTQAPSVSILEDVYSESEAVSKKYRGGVRREDVSDHNEKLNRIINPEMEVSREYIPPKPVENPIHSMFRGAKRNLDFNISVEISDKLPRLDFIEMMEDTYEESIIDFLADEFSKKLISDPSIIKESIKNKISLMVFGEEEMLKRQTETIVVDEESVEETKEEQSSNQLEFNFEA